MPDELLEKFLAAPIRAGANWFNTHGLIAWMALGVVLLLTLAPKFFESYDIWMARVLHPLAKWLKFKILVRAATKYDVRGHVNRAIGRLAKELPDGWVSDLEIRWVNNETREQFFEKNSIVVRVRPLQKQDENFVTVVHLFLKQALFGNVRHIIPELQRMAAILYFGDRISTLRGESTSKAFGERVFEPAVSGKKRILEYYQRYADLDEKGFFTGPFLREVQHVALEVRATRFRDNMGAEMNQALTHLESFCTAYEKSRSDGTPINEADWRRRGIMTKYGLLLVAHPNKAMVDADGKGYVARAERNYRENVRRLYVLGSSGQREFAKKVIHEIKARTRYELEQEFDLYRDYRGNVGGIGALFVAPDEA
jgi:hypothetical protein